MVRARHGSEQSREGLAVDSVGDLFATGDFTSIGGTSATRVAKWSGGAWAALGSGLGSSGTVLVSSSAGTVYAGGAFSSAGGSTVPRLAYWNGTSWSAVGSALLGDVVDLAVSSTGQVFVANSGVATVGQAVVSDLVPSGEASLARATNGDVELLYIDSSFDVKLKTFSTSSLTWEAPSPCMLARASLLPFRSAIRTTRRLRRSLSLAR